MKLPPLLPEETYHRVLRTAYLDGLSVMAVAGLLALAAASMRDFANTGIGMLVAAAGAVELHGVGLLRTGDARGMKWVLTSQPYLWFVLVAYCAVQLLTRDTAALRQALDAGVPSGLTRQSGYTEEQLIGMIYTPMYVALVVGTTLLQGGMTLYYWRRRAAVVAAVEGEE